MYLLIPSTCVRKKRGTMTDQEKPNTSPAAGDDEGSFAGLTRQKTYDFDHAKGWKRYRVLQPFRGMYHDVKRRLPNY